MYTEAFCQRAIAIVLRLVVGWSWRGMGCTVCFSNVVVLQLKIEKIIINGILNCSMLFFSIGTLSQLFLTLCFGISIICYAQKQCSKQQPTKHVTCMIANTIQKEYKTVVKQLLKQAFGVAELEHEEQWNL